MSTFNFNFNFLNNKLHVLVLNNGEFDMDASCWTQNVLVVDDHTNRWLAVTGVVWEHPEGEELEAWFEEAVQFAQAGYEGYSLV